MFAYAKQLKCTLRQEGLWRNGSASDSRSEGWEFESLWPHFVCMAVYTNPTHRHQIVEFRVCIPVPNGVHKSRYRRLERKNVKCLGRMEANQVSCNAKKCRQGGGIEPLHVSMPRELKSRPSTSPTHPGLMRKQKKCALMNLPAEMLIKSKYTETEHKLKLNKFNKHVAQLSFDCRPTAAPL